MADLLSRNWALFAARLAFVAIGLMLLVTPVVFRPDTIRLATEFLTLLVLAQMWNLLAGYADIISVGQHGFVGVGSYAFYGLVALAHLDPILAIPLAGLVALLVSVPVLAIVFRLRAAYLAIGTWVIAEVLMLISGKIPGFGLGAGVSVPISVLRAFGARPADRYAAIFWITLLVAVLAYASSFLLLRSRIGVGLTAMRDNEEGAGSIGVDLVRSRILAFLWAAPFLGAMGALIALQKLHITPASSFSITDWTVDVIFIVVIGGIGSLEGPILGTAAYFVIRELLADYGTWHLIALGATAILVTLVEPRGLWGLMSRLSHDNIIPLSHRASSAFAKRWGAASQEPR